MNSHPLIINGKLHTAYALFFRTSGGVSPEKLIQSLGLSHYHAGMVDASDYNYITVADDGNWIHLCDSFTYDYWYDPDVLVSTRKIARVYDTLMLTFPDTDDSYEIEYWQGGTIRRRIFWEDTSVWGKSIGLWVKRIGKKLPGETSIKKGKDPYAGLWEVATSLGINTDYKSLTLSTFIDKSRLENKGLSIAKARHGRGIILPRDAN